MGVKYFMSIVLAAGFICATNAQTTYSFDFEEYDPVSEDAGTITICIRRTGSVADDINIEVEVTQGPAISGTDFEQIDAFSFKSGNTVACRQITIVNDNAEEGTETFTLEISSDVETGANSDTVITITDDEQDEEYYWDDGARTVAEASGYVSICMSRTGLTPSRTIEVSYSGTALKDSDYTEVDSWSFASGVSRVCRSIPINDDNGDESTETIIITIDSTDDDGDAVDVGDPSSVTISITDDDDAETYSFSLSSYPAFETTESVDVCMRRTGSTNTARNIQVTFTNGNAISGTDFITGPSFYFGVNSGERCNSISIIDDDEPEDTESFTISILTTGNTGIEIGSPSITTVSIQDNDDEETIEWAQPTYIFAESAGIVSVTVTKSGTSKAVTANVIAYNSANIDGSDYQLGSSTIYIPANSQQGSLQITINEDTEDEYSESFTLTLVSATNGVIITQASTTVTITDNDMPTRPPPADRLSDGEIVGIAFGVVGLVVLIIIIVIVYMYMSSDGDSLLDMCFPKSKPEPQPRLGLQQQQQQQLQLQQQLQHQLQQEEQLQVFNNAAVFGNDLIL